MDNKQHERNNKTEVYLEITVHVHTQLFPLNLPHRQQYEEFEQKQVLLSSQKVRDMMFSEQCR